MSLVTIGMSHKTASLDVREKLAIDKNESQKILKKLHSMPLVDEAFILSTCNRTELYIEIEDLKYVDNISNWLLRQKGLSIEDFENILMIEAINSINLSTYKNKPVIIKGCTNKKFKKYFYSLLIDKIQPVAKSIMFGEACSSVPIFKAKK